MASPAAESLMGLLKRLVTYKVHAWSGTSKDPDMISDRTAASLDDADVVSSRLDGDPLADRHMVVLDIDHPTWLVKSTTPGHYHLYIDVPGGVEWFDYQDVLWALADAGVIERGYASASINRGFTCVRLPWVKKKASA